MSKTELRYFSISFSYCNTSPFAINIHFIILPAPLPLNIMNPRDTRYRFNTSHKYSKIQDPQESHQSNAKDHQASTQTTESASKQHRFSDFVHKFKERHDEKRAEKQKKKEEERNIERENEKRATMKSVNGYIVSHLASVEQHRLSPLTLPRIHCQKRPNQRVKSARTQNALRFRGRMT